MRNKLNHKDIDKLVAGYSLIHYQSMPWYTSLVNNRAEPIYFICPANSTAHVPISHNTSPILSAFMPSDSLKTLETELPTHLPKDNLVIYTDASYISNTNLHFGGLGVVFVINNEPYGYQAGIITSQYISNTDLECLAAGLAITKAISMGYKSIDIYYDANTIMDLHSESLNTTPVADFCRSILKVADQTNTEISYHHVKAHTGDRFNTLADYLAGASQESARMFAKRQNFNVVEASTIKKAVDTLISVKGTKEESAKPKKNKAKTKSKEGSPKVNNPKPKNSNTKPKVKLVPYKTPLNARKCLGPKGAAIAKILNVNPDKLNATLDKTGFSKLEGIGSSSNNKIKNLLKNGDIKIQEQQINNIAKSLYGHTCPPKNLNNKLGIMILAIIYTMNLDMKESLNKISQYDLTDISI